MATVKKMHCIPCIKNYLNKRSLSDFGLSDALDAWKYF
jgi:hypothetical protein